VCVSPAARGVGGDALRQRQRAAEQHDVSVAGESAEVAEEPATRASVRWVSGRLLTETNGLKTVTMT